MADDLNERVRDIIQRPVDELVEMGLEGGEVAACSLLASQYIGRLYLAGALDELQALADELDADLNATDDPPERPSLRVVS